jgi:hypothetical protein
MVIKILMKLATVIVIKNIVVNIENFKRKTMKKFNGSVLYFFIWLVVCWPIALIYWIVKQEEVKPGHIAYRDPKRKKESIWTRYRIYRK